MVKRYSKWLFDDVSAKLYFYDSLQWSPADLGQISGKRVEMRLFNQVTLGDASASERAMLDAGTQINKIVMDEWT